MFILKHRDRTVVPGGGGNAVMNLASLGGMYRLLHRGDDESGALLLASGK